MFNEFAFERAKINSEQVDHLRVNFGEKLIAKALLSRGLEVALHPCVFRATFCRHDEEMAKEYAHIPDFAVRNPKRPNSQWGFIEVTTSVKARLPDWHDGSCARSGNKFKQKAVMNHHPEVRYVQLGRENLHNWASKLGLR